MVEDVVIIGAGPAGIAAAIQLKRHGLEPVLLDRSGAGGLLRNANLVENYPGFPGGISGPDLVERFRKQLADVGIETLREEVYDVEYLDEVDVFKLETIDGKRYCRILVVATGTVPLKAGEVEASGAVCHRILHEIHPIRRVEGARIAIVGAGDAAFDYALTLSGKNDVVILNRKTRTRCLPLLRERCERKKSIRYREEVTVHEIGERNGTPLLHCSSPGSASAQPFSLHVDYVVFAIGRVPNRSILGPNDEGVGPAGTLDSLIEAGKIYMIGDVVNGRRRQLSISVGDGVKAAMRIAEIMQVAKDME